MELSAYLKMINDTEKALLETLKAHGTIGIAELAAMYNVTKAYMNKKIEKLTTIGLVARDDKGRWSVQGG